MRVLLNDICKNLQNTACATLFDYVYYSNKYGICNYVTCDMSHVTRSNFFTTFSWWHLEQLSFWYLSWKVAFWHIDILTYGHIDILTCWHTDMMFSDIVLTFWTTFILITKLKSCILTYWHIDILTCWHIDIRTYWHTEILFSDILLTFWTTFLLITKLRIDLKFWPFFSLFWGGHQDL